MNADKIKQAIRELNNARTYLAEALSSLEEVEIGYSLEPLEVLHAATDEESSHLTRLLEDLETE